MANATTTPTTPTTAAPTAAFDPMAMWQSTQQTWHKLMVDAEAQMFARAHDAITTWAQLTHDALAYGVQLSHAARKLGTPAA